MKPSTSKVSLVLVGTFQPSALTIRALGGAAALAHNDIASAEYAALLPEQIVDIRFPWGRMAAVADRFLIETNEAPYIRVADLAIKCLREISSAVVTQMGINYVAHFAMNQAERDRLGSRLMPPERWGSWGQSIAASFALPVTDPRHGGMLLGIMRQGVPDARPGGHIDARVESAMHNGAHGVQVSINDHYEFPKPQEGQAGSSERVMTAQLLDLLESGFDTSIARSIDIANDIVTAP